MSLVPEYDMTIKQGADWSLTLTVKDNNDVAKDLTAYTAAMQIRTSPYGELIKSLATSGSGITITAATGEIALALTNAETAALSIENGEYDLFLTSGSSVKTCLVQGKVGIVPRVTK